jgi:hypothetical protein
LFRVPRRSQVGARPSHPNIDRKGSPPPAHPVAKLRAKLSELFIAKMLHSKHDPNTRTKKIKAARLRCGLRSIKPKSENSAQIA